MDKFLNLLNTFKKLKSLARVVSLTIIHTNLIESLREAIQTSLFVKSIDLSEGVIRMYEEDLPENAQILIRTLFETNVNFGYFLSLIQSVGEDAACFKCFYGVVLESKKNYTQQGLLERWNDKVMLYDLEEHFKSTGDFNGMKKNGFSSVSIEERAKISGRVDEYNMMYRNFSRNAHANDLVEYLIKIKSFDSEQIYHQDRDEAALIHSFLSLYQMTVFVSKSFGIKADEGLSEIDQEYDALIGE